MDAKQIAKSIFDASKLIESYPMHAWLVSPDRQGSLDLGVCADEAEVIAGIEQCVEVGSGDEDWDGWTVSE